MAFQKLSAFTKKVADFADQPTGTPAEIKAQFDAAPEELRQSFNNLCDDVQNLVAKKDQETWTTFFPSNGWVWSGGDVQEPKYFKSETGMVYLEGDMWNGNTIDGTALTILPPGYRPAHTIYRPILSNRNPAILEINSLGEVRILKVTSTYALNIGGVCFRAEQ